LTVAVLEVLAAMQERIFEQGKAANGAKIGEYSTTPAYFSVPYAQVANKGRKPVGKTGKSVFKSTGKKHKSQYLEGGYKDFRNAVGREDGFVNLDLTGSLRLSMNAGRWKNGIAIGFTQAESEGKATGNEARFGVKIFELSAEEKAIFEKALEREINMLIKKIGLNN